MYYSSTRSNIKGVSAAKAIIAGLAVDGGLFIPSEIPIIDKKFMEMLIPGDYCQRAQAILSLFLGDYTQDEIKRCVAAAYGTGKFPAGSEAPVVTINSLLHILELWHGPTHAFKDMALQLLPQLLTQALQKESIDKEVVILVATSGDTGKAALEGFKDVKQTKIIVYYPRDGVSKIQQLQMVTQEGENVGVFGVAGNFDDAQSGVKALFGDEKLRNKLAEQGYMFSSANSINWGRLVPQIVYYFSAYADLVKKGQILIGQKVNFVVPTGNFGNILAGFYAIKLGLPVNKLICASNANNVLTDFLKTGKYSRLRPFHKTISPSMDILISSNLERLLYHITDGDYKQIAEWMNQLATCGEYSIDDKSFNLIKDTFYAGYCDDVMTTKHIKKIYQTQNYVCDPHTAVAWAVYDQYCQETKDATPSVIVSTASPFKFNESVLQAIDEKDGSWSDEFAALRKLSVLTGWEIPSAMLEMEHKPIRFSEFCEKDMMKNMVEKMLCNQNE